MGIAAVVLLLPAVGAPEEGPGSWVRILARIWLIGWAVGSVIRFVIPPWRRTADPLNLARAVDDRVSETRDSLHAAVDLAGALDDGRWDDPVTRHLARDHLAAASDRVSVVDPRALLPWSSLGRGVLLGPGLLFVAGLVLLAAPEPSQRGWDRLFGPLPAGDFAAEDAESAEDAEPVTLVLRNLVLTLTPPAYSLRETLTLDGTTGDFQALPGTAVALAADVPSGGEDVAVVWYAPEGDPVRFEGTVRGDRVEVGFVAPGSGHYRVELGRGRIRETLRTRRFRVEALPDDPPDLEVSGLEGTVEVKPDDVLPLAVLASDDFALSRLELVVLKGRQEIARESIADVVGRPDFDGVHGWSPARLDGQGGELRLVVEAWDNDTVNGPKVTRSRAVEAWVPTPRDHHRKVLQLKKRLLDQSLDLLAALLVDNATLPRDGDREAILQQHDQEARLAVGLFQTASELGAAMEADPFEKRAVFLGIGTAIENLGRRWEEVVDVAETQIRPDTHLSIDRTTVRTLSLRREETISELERIVLDLEAFVDLQIGEDAADQLAGVEPQLADLADLIRQSSEGAMVDEEIEAAFQELQDALQEIAQQMAERSRGPDEGFQNRMPDGLQRSALEEIRELLEQGKHEEAMEKLRQAMDALDQMKDGLQQEQQQMAGGQEAEQLAQALQHGIEESKRLEAEQQALLDETRAMQERFGTGDPFNEAQQEQLAEDIEELQQRIGALPPQGLTPRTRGGVQSWARAAAQSADRLEQRMDEGDLNSAMQQASEASAYLDEARDELRTASGDSAEAVDDARRDVQAAADLAEDIRQRLADAEALARRAQGQAASASEGMQERQGQTAEGVGELRQQMEEMGGSAYNPVSGRENLDAAGQMMQRSRGRLGQGRTQPAIGSQEGAIGQLQAFRQSLEEQQQAMQSGQRMGQQPGQGQPQQGQGSQQGPWARADDHSGDSTDHDEVELPDPDDFDSPEAFRALVQEEAGGDAPERYRPMNNSYYEELVK